MVII
jgi:hypothetical protein